MTVHPDTPAPVARLYIDFDSFFATAEQHFNPDLRGRPVGVVPLDAPNTGCIAVSREAKRMGVKSNASLRDARRIAPEMIFVVARHDVYVRLHRRIVAVVDSVLPVAEVRSIDEMVCHLTRTDAAEGAALAQRIKTALADAFSSGLTCSVGMAQTELLAKIAAERHKPDGFALIEAADLPEALQDVPLEDLPGVSSGMLARLSAAGVHDFRGLWALAAKQARAIWGNVEGERFWSELHGRHVERPATRKRMFGHSRVLPADWRTPDRLAACARQLALSAARRLRRSELRATRLTLSFRGGGYRSRRTSDDLRWSWETSFAAAKDDRTFLVALSAGLMVAQQEIAFAPRSVSVMLHGIVDEAAMTGDLFEAAGGDPALQAAARQRDQWEAVSATLDRLRSRHGPAAISLGPRVEMPGGYLGAKIAFGRIPEDADFSAAPCADEATHFLSH